MSKYEGINYFSCMEHLCDVIMLNLQAYLFKGTTLRCKLPVPCRSLKKENGSYIATGPWYQWLPSGKLTQQWKITMFNGKYIFKGSIFHCYVSLPECILKLSLDINDYQVSWGSGHIYVSLKRHHPGPLETWCKQLATYPPWNPSKLTCPGHIVLCIHGLGSHGNNGMTLGGGWDSSWKKTSPNWKIFPKWRKSSWFMFLKPS